MTRPKARPEMVETKRVEDRRQVSYASMDDILADVETLDEGEVRSSGNWTAGQNVQHVTRIIRASIDGFGVRAGLPFRIAGRLVRGMVLRRPMTPGFELPANMRAFLPDETPVAWADAVHELRHEMSRIRAGTKMNAPSPVFGALSHEQWVQLHCRHAELHFSFIHRA